MIQHKLSVSLMSAYSHLRTLLQTICNLLKADPQLAYSTGHNFAPDPRQHEWTFSIEPVTGYTLMVNLLRSRQCSILSIQTALRSASCLLVGMSHSL